MRIRFVTDYSGAETGENFQPRGTVIDLPNGEAQRCVQRGVAVLVVAEGKPDAPLTRPTPKKEKVKRG